MEGNYLLKIKQPDGKWKTFGNLKKGQYGNYRCGLRVTPELKQLIEGGQEWINFSVFEDKPKDYDSHQTPATHQRNQISDEIPF